MATPNCTSASRSGWRKLTGKEAALVFSTGFQTNLGVISALVGRNDVVFIDKLDHASVVDGCRLAAGETVRFRHGDINDLEAKLRHGRTAARS